MTITNWDVIIAQYNKDLPGGFANHYVWDPKGKSWSEAITLCGVPVGADTYLLIMSNYHLDPKTTFGTMSSVCPICRRIFVRELEIDRGYDNARIS